MKLPFAWATLPVLALFACTGALAQTDALDEAPAAAPATDAARIQSGSPRRAPLADVEDLEPAVDVSRLRTTRAPPAPVAAASGAGAATTPSGTAAAPGAPASAGGRPRRVIDTLDLGTTSITGNQELPKVLYIVPWKKSDLGDLMGRPVDTLLDEVLAPVDPEVFERHLQFYESLYGTAEKE